MLKKVFSQLIDYLMPKKQRSNIRMGNVQERQKPQKRPYSLMMTNRWDTKGTGVHKYMYKSRI